MIEKLFNFYKNRPSDINEHLDTLLRYGRECDLITEMGVRGGESTCALLHSRPKKMTSYDLNETYFDTKNLLIDDCKLNSIEFKFLIDDSLVVDIDQTELLFIDTLHTYNQLSIELNKHASKVLRYIILHDTTTYGFEDENIYSHASDLIKIAPKTKQGLFPAVTDFIKNNSHWIIQEKFDNNNGLTILKNINNL